jgi:hypothetical protein
MGGNGLGRGWACAGYGLGWPSAALGMGLAGRGLFIVWSWHVLGWGGLDYASAGLSTDWACVGYGLCRA